MAQHTDAELLDLIDKTVSGTPFKIHTESEITKPGSNTSDKVSDTLASMEPNCELYAVTKPGTRLQMKQEDSHIRETEHVEQETVLRQDVQVANRMELKVQEPLPEVLVRKGMKADSGNTCTSEIADDPSGINSKYEEDKMNSIKQNGDLYIKSQEEPLACLTYPEINLLCETVEGVPATVQSDLHTKSALTSQTEFNAELVSLLSKDEIVNLVQECRHELEDTKKKLKRSERQLAKANDYNGVLRNMVEKLSGEIHRMKHTKLCSVHVQVDKEDFLAYTTGKVSMPNWQEAVDDHDSVSMDISMNEEGEAIQPPENEGPSLSIAEIVKQTAESVVQQQQSNVLYDQGYVYDENSGLYYHAASGYYYDQEKSLFYDPNAGIYYYYDYTTGKYLFHSQIDLHQQNQGNEHAAVNAHSSNKKRSSGPRKGKIPPRRGQERDGYPTEDKVFKNRKERRMSQLEERSKHWNRHFRDERFSGSDRGRSRKRWHSDSFSSDSEMSRSRSRSRSGESRSRSPGGQKSYQKKNKPRRRTSDSRDRERIKRKLERTITLSHSGESDVLVVENKDIFRKESKNSKKKKDPKIEKRTKSKELNSDNAIGKGEHRDSKGTQRKEPNINIITVNSETYELESENELMIIEDDEIKNEDKETVINKAEDEVVVDHEQIDEHGKEDVNSPKEKSHKKSRKHKKHRKHKKEKKKSSKEKVSLSDNVSDSEEASKGKADKFDKDNKDIEKIAISDNDRSEVESGELSDTDTEDQKERTMIIYSDSVSDSEYSSELLTTDDEDQDIYEDVVEEEAVPQPDVAESWPPCIRVMVIESESLMVGTFFIVTCTGAKIGRENCDICVPDLNVSKVHAIIQYKEESGQYEILDMASQNGTFLNDQRLSPAKIASEPFVVSHDDIVLVGTTKLLCHIHSGNDTCDRCEPGIVIATHKAQQPQTELKVMSKEERLRQKKQELNQIKKKYGLKNSAYVDNKEVFNNPNYSDKAGERRKVVGSDTPGQKQETPASVHRPISTSNVGHKLLQKMGWKEGESLGKNNSGIQEPISVTLRASQTAGLGSASAGNFSADDANTFDMKKASRRVQAQQRYNQIESEQTGSTKSSKQWNKGDTEFT